MWATGWVVATGCVVAVEGRRCCQQALLSPQSCVAALEDMRCGRQDALSTQGCVAAVEGQRCCQQVLLSPQSCVAALEGTGCGEQAVLLLWSCVAGGHEAQDLHASKSCVATWQSSGGQRCCMKGNDLRSLHLPLDL